MATTEGSQGWCGSAESVEQKLDRQTLSRGSEYTMLASTADVQNDLQSLAQQASNVAAQSDGIIDRDQEDVVLDVAPAIQMAPPPMPRDSELETPVSDKANVPVRSLQEAMGGGSSESTTKVFPDPTNEHIRDEQASDWRPNQDSYGIQWASEQYQTESMEESLDEHQIQAFAKLEFADGVFYMNTYVVELGRDKEAARQAEERRFEEGAGAGASSGSRSRKKGVSRAGSVKSDRSRRSSSQFAADGLLNENGTVAVDHDRSESKKEIRKKSRSESSPSQSYSRNNSMHSLMPNTDYNALAMASLMDLSGEPNGYPEVNPMPSPKVVPFIPIHPPPFPEGMTMGHKSISRVHIRIFYNFRIRQFQVDIIGRNGAFVNRIYYPQGEVISLSSGNFIQIGGVVIRFVLPDVPESDKAPQGDRSSNSLSDGQIGVDMTDSEEEVGEQETGDELLEEEARSEASLKSQVSHKAREAPPRGRGKKKVEAQLPIQTKRRPGRPPKNGVISKREQALQVRQAREEARAKAEDKVVKPSRQGKGKNSKDRTANNKVEPSTQPNGKRKYTKRKRAKDTEDQQIVRESTEHTDSVPLEQNYVAVLPPKPTKEKKPPKPERSPSPVFDESKMTAEQLAKPQSSYVILIHEALTNSKDGKMSLPQIYRAIERRYPFYKLRVQTQGWQSSVRHNLSQHNAFRKITRDGKGWLWGLVPEVSIEREKKRRATPPPPTQHHYYPPNPMAQRPYPYPGMPLPNGRLPPMPYGMPNGMPQSPMPYPPPFRPGFPLPILNATTESTYRSPYESNPPPTSPQVPPHPPQEPHQQRNTNMNSQNSYPPIPVFQPSNQTSNNNGDYGNSNNPPASHPPAAPGSTSTNNHVEQAINKFKTALTNTMDDKVHGEKLVTSAVNRVLGAQSKSSFEQEDPNEKTIMDAFSNMLGDLSKKKNAEAKQQQDPPFTPPALTAILETTNPKPQMPTATAVAAEQAAKIALANGEGASNAVSQPGQNPELNSGSSKRPLDDQDEGRPEAKRAASERLGGTPS